MAGITVESRYLSDISVGDLNVKWSARGDRILRYYIDFRHRTLNLHRELGAPDLSILQEKANALAQALEQRLGISSFETYLVRRRLRWLGHVRRMPWHRLPRKLLTSWVSSPRMACGQEMTYGRSILEDLRLAEEAGMVFPEAAEEVDAGVDELEVLSTAQLREKGK